MERTGVPGGFGVPGERSLLAGVEEQVFVAGVM
jgi:hypothetical protein